MVVVYISDTALKAFEVYVFIIQGVLHASDLKRTKAIQVSVVQIRRLSGQLFKSELTELLLLYPPPPPPHLSPTPTHTTQLVTS